MSTWNSAGAAGTFELSAGGAIGHSRWGHAAAAGGQTHAQTRDTTGAGLDAARREVRITGTLSRSTLEWVMANAVRIGAAGMAALYMDLVAANQSPAARAARFTSPEGGGILHLICSITRTGEASTS